MSERHPDTGQLADLAAEVLPVDVARSVEAHVMGCALCEGLLADAERVRHLLFADDPGPMPHDVWLRMEGALAAEAINRRRTADGTRPGGAAGWFDAPATPVPAMPAFPSAATGTPLPPEPPTHIDLTRPVPPISPSAPAAPPSPPAAPSAYLDLPSVESTPYVMQPPSPPPSMSFDEAPTAAWKAFLDDPGPASPSTEPVPLRVGRAVRSTVVRSRRDVRSEDRAAGRRPRPVVLAAAAAAVVAVVGIGFAATALLRGDDHSGPSLGADLTARSSIVHTSGREYTASTLVAQVRVLLGLPASPAASAAASPSGSASPAASAAPTASASAGRASASPVPTDGTVAQPDRLQSCLAGLGFKNQPVLAVDIARYQGRAAAVIVLQGQGGGGFDIWVVPPECKVGNEMPIAFKSVPS